MYGYVCSLVCSILIKLISVKPCSIDVVVDGLDVCWPRPDIWNVSIVRVPDAVCPYVNSVPLYPFMHSVMICCAWT